MPSKSVTRSTKKLTVARKRLNQLDDTDAEAATLFVGATSVGFEKMEDFHSYIRAGSKRIWAVYKSCRLVADVASTTDFTLQLDNDTEPQTDKWITALLTKPNDYDTFGDFVARWMFHAKLTGNVFALKDQTNGKGWPRKLWLLNPKHVRIVVDKKAGLVGYKYYNGDGTFIPYDVEEIIHWRLPHPDSEFWGLGEVEAGESLFNMVLAQDSFLTNFYSKGATPSGIMSREEEMDPTEFKKLKAKFSEEYGGTKNAGKTAWLTGKWNYQRLGLSLKEMEAVAANKARIEEIFALMGIPLTMAGVASASNYAVSQQDDVRFRRYTVLPLLKIFAERFNAEVVKPIRPDLWFVWNLGGLAYIKDVVDDHKDLIANAAMTPNELRDVVGMSRSDDPLADELFIGTNLVPLALVGATAAPAPGGGTDNRNAGRTSDMNGNPTGSMMGATPQKSIEQDAGLVQWHGTLAARADWLAKKKSAASTAQRMPNARAAMIGKPLSQTGPSKAFNMQVGKPLSLQPQTKRLGSI